MQTDILPVTPMFPVERQYLPGIIYDEADSGRGFSRLKRAPRKVHHLVFKLTTDQKQLLEQWYDRFQNSWFSFYDPVFGKNPDTGVDLPRYFSVRFSSPPTYSNSQNNLWTADCQVTDAVGMQLFEYPDPDAGHVSAFIESEDGFIVSGTWAFTLFATAHGGFENVNANTNTTDAFSFVYGGYGFRLWARTGLGLGKFNVFADGVNWGPVDLYSPVETVSKVVFSKLDLPLGLHTVTLVATNTRNVASIGNWILADAIEVMN